jgi:ComF family protein
VLPRRLASLLAPPLCAACESAAGRGSEPLCAPCRRELRWLTAGAELGGVPVWAPVAYEGPARALVTALKFRGALTAAAAMAAQMAANAPPGVLDSGRLVPVPLHPRRLRRRGFNQAERLSAAISARTGLTVHDCLVRGGAPVTQVGRDRSARLQGVAGTVSLRPGAEAPEGRAILVDDVATTGATLASCAAALRAEGAREVTAVAYARTPGR